MADWVNLRARRVNFVLLHAAAAIGGGGADGEVAVLDYAGGGHQELHLGELDGGEFQRTKSKVVSGKNAGE